MTLSIPRSCGLTLFALLCGCHLIFPFDASGPPPDLGVAVDDARGDVPHHDADAVIDLLPPNDGKLPLGDGPPVDGPQGDGPPVDGPQGATVPCSPKGKPLPTPVAGWDHSKMRVCVKANAITMTQCQAAALCNTTGGWSLCEPGDYLNNGGKSAGTTSKAWLKACIRAGGASYSPKNTICASCYLTSGSQTPTHWTCAGGVLPLSIFSHMGLRAGDSCRRVGINDTSTAGYWIPATSSTASMDGAVCCHP